MKKTGKPQYLTLVRTLDELRKEVDGSVLNACSPQEVHDSYKELCNASVRAEQVVQRAYAALERRGRHNDNRI